MPGMKPSLADKLARADDRLVELDALLAQPEIAGDMESFRKLSSERAELDPVVALYRQYRQLEADQKTAQELLADPDKLSRYGANAWKYGIRDAAEVMAKRVLALIDQPAD